MELPFRTVQRVYFDDLDALHILHNVRYMLFMERARGEFLEALGVHWQNASASPDKFHVIAAHEIEYRVPVRGQGELMVEIRPHHMGRTSFVVDAWVTSIDGSVEHATAKTRLVRLDPATNTPCPWSDDFRSKAEALLAQQRATGEGSASHPTH